MLEQREIERLGGSGPVAIDVRVLAATHRDLRQAVADGQFRQDLYFRLAVFPLRVPPLRERPDDLLPLIKAFAAELVGAAAPRSPSRPRARRPCAAHPLPGNVRELRNFVERLVLLRGRGPLFIDAAVTAVLALGDPLPPTAAGSGGDAGERHRRGRQRRDRRAGREGLPRAGRRLRAGPGARGAGAQRAATWRPPPAC